MDLDHFLREISQKDGVSGFESNIADVIKDAFLPYIDEMRSDSLGNLIFLKRGRKTNLIRVLLCAHMDEIGLIITKIEKNGFLRFTSLGGFDARTLPGQEVTIYGEKILEGIIAVKPPHLYKDEEKERSVEIENLFIDTGLPVESVQKVVRPGTVVALKRAYLTLLHQHRSGKALDDRAGVAVLWQCVKELANFNHDADLYLVATVQEEVGIRGAVVSAYGISPDLGIAVDVCHGDFPGSLSHEVVPLGKGPAITSGPNIHPHIAKKLLEVAENYYLPYQKDVSPGPTGTDARALQVSAGGIPTGLVSVPLRYMHTSVELVHLEDIRVAGRLLACFVAGLNSAFVEGLSCL